MNTEILGVIFIFAASVALAIPLGKYISKVYGGEHTWLDRFFNPVEKIFFRIAGIDPLKQMGWKQNLIALLTMTLYGLSSRCLSSPT